MVVTKYAIDCKSVVCNPPREDGKALLDPLIPMNEHGQRHV
jgi:hypothetical protein